MKNFLRLLFLAAATWFAAPFIASGEPIAIAGTVIAYATIVPNLVMPYVSTGMFAMTNLDARMVFENAERALIKAFGTPAILDVVKLTQGSLRLEQAIVAAQTLYEFPVLDNQNLFSNTEERLKLQDSFIISSIKVCTGAPASATDNAFLPDSYGNPVKYGVAPAAALSALYNAGQLQISVNRDVILPVWDIYRHYNANQTQQTAALGAGSPQDQDRGSFDGWYPVEPNIVMIGQKNTEVKIVFNGAGIASVLANSRIIIMFRGVLAQNSTLVS